MRETGLDEAIRVAGGVGALARKIGISQPSVSNWVANSCGACARRRGSDWHRSQRAASRSLQRTSSKWWRPRRGRCRARPGIHAAGGAARRARPTRRCSIKLGDLARRCVAAGRRPCRARGSRQPHHGRARRARVLQSLHRARARGTVALRFVLSIRVPARAPAGAAARAALAAFGIERAEGQSEPEDHAAILCEIMAGLINGRLPAEAGADRDLFEKASVALDRTVLRRSGASRGGRRSTAVSGRSAACSWKWRLRLSRCRHRAVECASSERPREGRR